VETLSDFDMAITWLMETQHEQLALEEAILSVMASLDKPGSPAGEAKRDFYERLFGRTDEHRKMLRAGIVNTTLDDLQRVADTYLKPELASTAVITHSAGADVVTEQGLVLTRQELL
jgi:Zn-dependent M16 (insulinase) family peptidase